MPYIQQELSFDVAGFLSIILFPFAVSFLLPLYVNAIVTEKQERLREMMKMVRYWIQILHYHQFYLQVWMNCTDGTQNEQLLDCQLPL